jgi:type I restriction enzyme S subunit
MELKPGYKQTEVGVIPEDWNVTQLGKCLAAPPSYGINAPAVPYSDQLPVYIRITDISNDGTFMPDGLASVGSGLAKNYYLSEGDIVLARTGASVGKSYLYDPSDGPLVFAGFLIRVRPEKDKLLPSFAAAYITTEPYWRWVRVMSMRSGQPGINGKEYSHLPIPLPCVSEQSAITAILNDLDTLLSDLKSLIGKKKNIKQAAMQELLTGKRRLPGFEGEWKVKRLGAEIRDLEAGVSVRSTTDKDQPSTGRYILKTSAVSQGQFSPTETKEIISCDISRAKTPIKAGDLIISRMNTPALVGECGYSHSDHPNLFLPDRLWRAAYRDLQAVSSRWLSYTLSTHQNRTRIKELATGTSGSMKNISKRALLDLEIKWPSLDEQNAIAEFLSEMDDDIDAINAQLQKAQGVKQGMMQQLLTGKIRLT